VNFSPTNARWVPLYLVAPGMVLLGVFCYYLSFSGDSSAVAADNSGTITTTTSSTITTTTTPGTSPPKKGGDGQVKEGGDIAQPEAPPPSNGESKVNPSEAEVPGKEGGQVDGQADDLPEESKKEK